MSLFGSIANDAFDGPTTGIARGAVSAIDDAVGGAGNREAIRSILGLKDKSEFEETPVVSGQVGGGRVLPFRDPGTAAKVSQWGGLSPHLIARLWACDPGGKALAGAPDIYAPITDCNFEATLNWQSPFENAGPESKAPALMALLQSGQVAPIAQALQSRLGPDGAIGNFLGSVAEGARELEGRTGITKLNSRQVFSGMPPIRLTMTMHFRAMQDAKGEVVDPFTRLLQWALPQELAKDGVLAGVIQNASDAGSFIKALFPSRAPQLVGFTYANERYSPMVIENIGRQIDVQRTGKGLPVYLAVPVTLATLTALDKSDVVKLFSRS